MSQDTLPSPFSIASTRTWALARTLPRRARVAHPRAATTHVRSRQAAPAWANAPLRTAPTQAIAAAVKPSPPACPASSAPQVRGVASSCAEARDTRPGCANTEMVAHTAYAASVSREPREEPGQSVMIFCKIYFFSPEITGYLTRVLFPARTVALMGGAGGVTAVSPS